MTHEDIIKILKTEIRIAIREVYDFMATGDHRMKAGAKLKAYEHSLLLLLKAKHA